MRHLNKIVTEKYFNNYSISELHDILVHGMVRGRDFRLLSTRGLSVTQIVLAVHQWAHSEITREKIQTLLLRIRIFEVGNCNW